MKLILSLFLITAVVLYTEAQECPEECPDCNKKSDGETWKGYRSEGCYQVTCRKRGKLTSWSGKGCSFDVPPFCYALDGSNDAPYPECCPHLACA